MEKYPRTPHLPWSKGHTPDDIVLNTFDHLAGLSEIVVTEKLDGENTTMHRDYIHARSPDSGFHPSRSWVTMHHAAIRYNIPENMKICGENMFARHSIAYDALESYFYVFAVIDGDRVLPWDDTVEIAELLELPVVPLLYRGSWSIERIQECWTGISRCGGEQEGYVIRNAAGFALEEFQNNTAKYVRPGHVTSEQHWTKGPVIRNGLREPRC